jgi:3',5'-cyclic AMP phosphodiesterase CpdA
MGARAVKPGPFAFAHLTDPHLPLAAGDAPLRLLLSKRITGYLSWTRNRQHIHRPEVLAALIADVRAHAPDHVAVTGDLANISTPGEMARARDWLASLGSAADVTVIPGNHDVYVRDAGFGLWAANMQGDRGEGFPFVRRRGPVAFIGVTTGVPTPFFMAHGALGAAQAEQLDDVLALLGEEGACRVVLLHHPPSGKAGAKRRKGLRDRAAFANIIRARPLRRLGLGRSGTARRAGELEPDPRSRRAGRMAAERGSPGAGAGRDVPHPPQPRPGRINAVFAEHASGMGAAAGAVLEAGPREQ